MNGNVLSEAQFDKNTRNRRKNDFNGAIKNTDSVTETESEN
jgi:hypothetical protein